MTNLVFFRTSKDSENSKLLLMINHCMIALLMSKGFILFDES